VRYDFFSYRTETFVENAKAWSFISELANDNLGWYAEGADVLAHSYDPTVDYTVVGDEAWGWGGEPGSVDEMVSAVLPNTLARSFVEASKPLMRETCEAMYRTSIMRVLQASENTGLSEQKDFLYVHGRVARFIFSLGYYKELATQVRRPFLTKAVLDVVRGLPRRFRYHKNLYRSVLSTYFPEVSRFPINLSSSLPDWRYDLRHQSGLRNFFTQLLSQKTLDASAVSELLEPAAVERAWRNHLRLREPAINRRPGTKQLLRYWLIPERLKAWNNERGSKLGGVAPRTDFDFFRALALLVLFEGQFRALAH
jgi:hypothetical protein